ncbi:MAG TPA: mechanosensitive ion channel family protein [Burkholderiales bacterium]|nr:mechanosensitive ion channel family protein [Burkholderiales bacterium]
MIRDLRRTLLAGLLALAAASPAAAQSAKDAKEAAAVPAELDLANRPIVTFRAGVGAITPSARVAAVKSRASALEKSDLEQPVVSKAASIGGQPAYAIEINGKPLLAIVQDDVDPAAGERLDDVVQRAVTQLNAAREAYLELHRGTFVAEQTGLATGAILAFVLAWYLLARVRAGIRERASAAITRRVGRVSPKGLDLANFAIGITQRALAALYYAVVAFGAYVALTIALNRFAYTRPWGSRLKGWLLDFLLELLNGIIAALPGLFAACVIFLLAWLVVRGMNAVLARVERGEIDLPGLHSDTASATRSIATILVWLFALTVAFPYLPGSDSEVFKGVSLFAGLMVTLGSSGIVGQWMAGITLIYSRAMREGDLVKVGDNEGVVINVGLLSTKIRTATFEEITIPNSSLISGSIRNFTRLNKGSGSRVSTTVTIGYDAPWRQVHAMLLEAAARTQGLRTEPPPFVLQRALSDFYVEYELVGRIDEPLERPYIMTRLHGNVQDLFNEHGVQILSPHYMTQPPEAVVVDKRNWYAPPAKPD